MEKPKFEYEGLKQAVERCGKNIESFREGIKREEDYKMELLFYIKQHEKYQEYLKSIGGQE